MSLFRVRDLKDSTHSGLKDHGHVRVRRHPGDRLADSLHRLLSIVIVGGLPSIRRTVLALYFRGTSMIFFPRQCTSPGVRDS